MKRKIYNLTNILIKWRVESGDHSWSFHNYVICMLRWYIHRFETFLVSKEIKEQYSFKEALPGAVGYISKVGDKICYGRVWRELEKEGAVSHF